MEADGQPVIHTVRERRPVPALARHVTCVWIQEVAPDSASFTHRAAPNGSVEVVYALGSSPRVRGPRTGPLEAVLAPGTKVVGVRLRPGAAPGLLAMPASDLVDLDLAADELGRLQAPALEDALARAGSAQQAATLLEQAVADRLADGWDLDPLATEAVHLLTSGQATTLASLVSALSISERQLRRRCEAAVGLAPKALHRIIRFQRFIALAWTLEQPSAHLTRLAYEAGYADQAHLTREAARLQGASSRALLLDSEQRCGCGHNHSASYGPLLAAHDARLSAR